MAKLKFEGDVVRRIVEHMTTSTNWSKGYGEKGKPHPQLVLVKDEGIYILSNGAPVQMEPEGNKRLVCYAKGYDPTRADRMDVWDRARDAVGGDDFAEYLTLSPAQLAAILGGDFKHLEIGVNRNSISVAVATNSPQPARPISDTELLAGLQRRMRTRMFVVIDGKIRHSKPFPASTIARLKTDPAFLADMRRRFQTDTILNVLPAAELLAIYRQATDTPQA